MTWSVRNWNVQEQFFVIVNHRVTIDANDIYFLTKLSHRGTDLSLFGSRMGGDTTDAYIRRFCRGAPPKDGRIDIQTIELLPLRIIAFIVHTLCGSASLLLATWAQMQMVVECWESMIYNWCKAVAVNMKFQLTRCKNGKLKNFGYGVILNTFSLERVLIL